MRVRIIRARHGEIGGSDLSQFVVGVAYDLSLTLAGYLMLTNSAEAVDDSETDRRETMLYGGVPPPPDVADDAGMDNDFIEVFERVCLTSMNGPLTIPMDFDDGVKTFLQTPAPRQQRKKSESRPKLGRWRKEQHQR